ncbi:MAG TPA: tetratricopeptide repeat protein [Streptosporangiaceae bacterium]|nr:tetratricopeptide repeat protein [Streptosporangiaceae bacterium]
MRSRRHIAAPWVVGALTAMAAVMTTSLDAFNMPVAARLGIIGGGSVLAGLVAWGSQRPLVRHEAVPGAEEDAAARPPGQLPPVIAHFTGRADALAELREVFAVHLSRRRTRSRTGSAAPAAPLVVSLHGPGGVGKSALAGRFAHEVAGRFPDGQLYFDLRGGAGADDERTARVAPAEVLTGFLLALGARLTTAPGGLPELQKLWWTWLKDRRILIFLDNARDGEQVRALLPPEAGCAVLITSRQPLYLRHTYDLRLSAFTESQGVELLARLAGDERVSADPAAALEVVELCGRLPLAIGICGGRLAARENWSLRMMADRLGDERRRRLDELEITRRIDQSVRASLQLSYDDCTDVQRRLLRSLGLLAAPDVQGWVAGDLLATSDIEGGDHLEALVDAQLAEYSGQDATGEMRYRLHNLVGLYARERAEVEDDEEARRAAIERVMDGYRERAEAIAAARWPQDWHRQGGQRRAGGAGPASMDWLSSERLALLASIDQAARLEMWELVWRLGRAICSLCHSMRVFWPEWRDVAEFTCQAAERLGDARRLGIALLERAAVVGGQGQIEPSSADAERALEIFTELRERWWAARARRTVAMNLRAAGNLDAAQRHFIEAIETFRAVDDRWWRARTQRNLADVRQSQGRYVEARELLEDARAVFEHNGNRYSEAQTLRVLGEVIAAEAREARQRGDEPTAERRYNMAALTLEHAAERFRLRHEPWEQARCLRSAGDVGDPRSGLRELSFVRTAKGMLEGMGDSWGVARTLLSEGAALARLQRYAEAADALRQALEGFRDLGDRWWQARTLRTLAEVLMDAGQRTSAQEPAVQAVEIYRSLGNVVGQGRAQAVLARATGAADDLDAERGRAESPP